MTAAPPLPIMMTELMFSSWETIVRRAWMMAQGNCSLSEYQRMMLEKPRAAHGSWLAMTLPGWKGDLTAAIAPWHRRASSNARRLRKTRL
jgi:hypothetical protein